MNFISAFDELSRLYDKEPIKETFNVKKSDGHFSIVNFAKNIHDNLIKNSVDCTVSLVDGYKVKVECDQFDGKAKAEKDTIDDLVLNTKELVDNNLEIDVEDHGNFRYYLIKTKETTVAEALTESVDLSSYRVALADYEDDDGYSQENEEFLLKPGQTKGDLVVYLSYNAGFIGIYVHDERPATEDEIKRMSSSTFNTIEGEDYTDYGEVDIADWLDESLKEAADDEEIEIVEDEIEVMADETPADIPVSEGPVAEEEPKQTIIECSKCGALAIVDEVEVDEESDLVNMKDECKFCEEKEGYKIVGSVVPYEAVEVADEAAETAGEEVATPELEETDE